MKRIQLGLSAMILSGCAVGPNYHHPQAPHAVRYTTKPMPASTVSAPTDAGKKQYFRNGQDIPLKWWTVFHSPALNRLVTDSIRGNPDIAAASASLKIAHENTLVQKAAFFPLVTGSYNPMRQLTAGTLSSNVASNAYLYTLSTTSMSISYMPDVLGLTRRQVESALAQEESAAFQSEAVYLTLTSNVILAAIQEASIRAQIQVTKRSIALARELLRTMERQRDLGFVSKEDVAAEATFLAQVEFALPALQLQLAQQRHLIASLRGTLPGNRLSERFYLHDFTLPESLPVKLPSQLVEQRPDVRAAEAQMHAASAQIGVAIANRLPNIMLSGTGGLMPVDYALSSIPLGFPVLPTGTPFFWMIAGNLMGTLFDAGSLKHQQGAAEAAYQLAMAQYRRVVLNAFEEVADALKAIQFDAKALTIATKQEQTAKTSMLIAKRKLELGRVSHLDVIHTEQAYQQALANLAQSQANRFTDTVVLFQALGGGWRDCGPLRLD